VFVYRVAMLSAALYGLIPFGVYIYMLVASITDRARGHEALLLDFIMLSARSSMSFLHCAQFVHMGCFIVALTFNDGYYGY